MEEKQKKTFKARLISMAVVVGIFFITGISLTFVLKAKQSNLDNLKGQNYQIEQQINEKQNEHDYKIKGIDENGNIVATEQYNEDYYKNEQNQSTNDGDKTIPIA